MTDSPRFVANGRHDLSPYAGFVDPIAANQKARFLSEAAQALAANDSALWRAQWGRTTSDREPDPRANVAQEAGWPTDPTPELFSWMYLGDALAARVVEFMAKECWQVQPFLKDGDDQDDETPFLKSWIELARTMRGGDENWFESDDGHPLFADLQELDVLAGINSYGVLYTGYDDGKPPDQPVKGLEELGSRPADDPAKRKEGTPSFSANGSGQAKGREKYKLTRNVKAGSRKVLFNQALPETLARVLAWEMNPESPRYQLPTHYQINQIDPNIAWSGSLPPTRTLTVHWTRVIHFADWHHHPRPGGGRVLAHSRMRSVLPELLGGRKINAAAEVSFWRNAMLKLFLETHPSMGGDVLWNRQETTDDFENMMNGMQQWMFLRGMHVNAVGPTVIDPTPHQLAKIQRICIKNGWPVRTFMGSELGQLAADTDKTQHKDRVKEREHNLLSPHLVAPAINRLILVGVLEEPSNDTYGLEWPPVGTQDEEKKAKVFLARMQGLAAAIAGNVTSMIPEKGLLVDEMDVPEDRADGYLKEAEKAIAEEEKQAQALADEHGMVPEAPPGFQHKPEPPVFPPQKVKPGEKLVQPKPNPFAKPAANYSPDQPRDDQGQWTDGGGGDGPNAEGRYPSRFNPKITYGSKDDRDSDDAHFQRKIDQSQAAVKSARAALDAKLGEDINELPHIKALRAALAEADKKVAAAKARVKKLTSNDSGSWVDNVFCPTGEGGGVDPTCSPDGSGGSSAAGGGGGTASGDTRSRQAGELADKPTLAGKSGSDRFASPALRADAADTLEAYRGTDGRWTPERQALHDEIVSNALAGKEKSDAPTMYFMGGGPASGKSTIIGKGGQVQVPDRAVLVDPDHFKTMLPEYKTGLAARDSHAAAFVHEESSEIGKRLQREASTAGYDTLMDGTGDSGIDKLAAKINQAKEAGQRVVAHYVTVDTDTAVARANERGQKTGRFVPEAVIRGVHAGVSRAVPEAIDRGLFDEFTLWDTNQSTPRKVAEARGKSLTIHDRGLWNKFVAKGR